MSPFILSYDNKIIIEYHNKMYDLMFVIIIIVILTYELLIPNHYDSFD